MNEEFSLLEDIFLHFMAKLFHRPLPAKKTGGSSTLEAQSTQRNKDFLFVAEPKVSPWRNADKEKALSSFTAKRIMPYY